MKKIIIILLILIPMAFNSCEKEKIEPEEFSLVGRTYAAQAYKSDGDWVFWVLMFNSETTIDRTARKTSTTGSIIGTPNTYTYILNYPELTIWNESGVKLLPFTFVNENTIRFTDSRGVLYEYVKQ